MDEITRAFVVAKAAANPGASIRLTHQFLDGSEGRACGFMPADWNGRAITISGKWW